GTTVVELSVDPMKKIHADDGSPLHPKLGPYFRDGHRRVDYILEYSIQKPNGARRHSTIFGNDNFLRRLRRSLSTRNSEAPLQPKEDPEFAAQEHRADYHEDDKSNKRKEFEENLQEAGLELEWDEENHVPGVGFLKIHAPWDILCREAELMKLKMPTKKTYEIKQGSNLVEKIRLFIHKATAPLHPKLDSNQQPGLKHLSHPFSREKEHLFDLSNKDKFFDSKTRSSIVSLCLSGGKGGGVTSTFIVQFPNKQNPDITSTENICKHHGRLQTNDWCTYSHRKYFGEKVGLYFAWLGVYTQMLIPASIVGVIVFLYGCATVDSNIPSMEICDPRNNIIMCPLCDRACSYWKLVTACGTARASHLFDNEATVFFSIFMALWAVLFMEHWKRRQMRLNYTWDLTGFGEEEEDHNRAEYEIRVMEKTMRQDQSAPKVKLHLTCVSLTFVLGFSSADSQVGCFLLFSQITLSFTMAFGVILYRISIKAALHMASAAGQSNIRATVKGTAAVINVVIIIILDEIYAKVARWLTILEVPKTDNSFDNRLIFKTFILKFVNAFTPIVYLAFFRGRLVGRPGKYLYVVGSYRMEECAHAGCLMELCIQLCITMLGKQFIQNNLFEIGIP
uniref:Anoctamin n=1 Tax=Oryzias sinensis TaxID=183150 RepID=A0A8C7XQQ3_9TELE